MRENPLVCVEADQVANPQQWISVVVFGRYEELPSVPEYESDRNLAYRLLSERPVWWEPGYAKTEFVNNERALDLVYFRIHIGQITVHRARS
jgi:nitroimidazol reductase NimA-like FMN-containing flavoprotein (pyridoxamine 5'-phosphate oxidase superfamily)